MNTNLDVLLVSDEEAIQNQIKNSIESKHVQVSVIPPNDVIREVNRTPRDMVIYLQSETGNAVENIQYIKSASPSTFVIFIAQSADFSLLRNVTRAGTEEFFVYPDELSLFLSRFPTIQQTYMAKKESDDQQSSHLLGRGRGHIISFYSGNGGVGKTALSASFAQTLKLESASEVVLIDFNMQFGGMEKLLSIQSNRSIADLLPVISELNETHIRNVSQTEEFSKLEVLVSPCDAEVAETLDDSFIANVLRTCRRSFDFVIIDLPTDINEKVVTALEESDRIYYILLPETPALKTLKQFEELSVRLGIELTSRMEILINQTGKDNEIKKKDLKNLLHFPIATSIRRDIKGLQPFVNKGVPVRRSSNEKN
ncbi:AAA family ATPase [Pontibacillus yanchengensis]|uniref:AAA family ATPase n=1 Tax=Pontibacillus yanchengensis TaxID=462910 RepID=UPI001F41A137|nr:AAA family ATPase [Pontibacillus yanchengensis]